MPTIELSRKDLEKLCGKKFSAKELEEALMFVKGEIDSSEGDSLKVDVKETNRPDLWSAEGIAREINGRLGKRKGIPQYKIGKSGLTVKIEESVKEARPLTVAAVVKGVKVSNDLLVQLIQLQEKVSGTFGRKRKEAAIGVYDFDKIKGNIRYYGAKPREKKFVPLEFKNEMNLDEIIEMHPKGKEFGHLLKGKKLYPIFEDSKGNVLSMPPIINSDYSGKVTEKTTNLFVEVSGFNIETLNTALNVMVMALADRGGKIEGVSMVDSNGKKFVTPNFGTKKISLEIEYVKKVSGLNLGEKEIISLLEKAGYEVGEKGKKLGLEYGNFRSDVLHAVDVVEDVLIGYGYNRIRPERARLSVVGSELGETAFIDKVRDVCVGLGLQEVLTFVLTSKEKQGRMIGLEGQEFVEIANPISLNWSIMRKNIFPEMLEFLSKNKHYEYPQKIFEVGKTIEIDPKSDSRTKEKNVLCIALSGKDYGFTSIKSAFEAVCRELGKKCAVKPLKHPSFEEGKSAEISGDSKGFFGEIRPVIRENFGLQYPVVILEMEL